MFRIDDATAATSMPTPEAAGTPGYFTEGNPTAGTPATNVRASWLNMLQEELVSLLSAAGLTPSKTTYTQVRDAIKAICAPNSTIGAAYSVGNSSLNVTLSNASASTLQTLSLTVPNGPPGSKYRLLLTSQAKFTQSTASAVFQNIQTIINDGVSTPGSGAIWAIPGANSTTTVFGIGDTLIMGPYAPGQSITLTQQGFQTGAAWNGKVTSAQLFVQAIQSFN